MLKRSLVLLYIVLFTTTLVHAHGEALVGTITAVSGDKITVKTPAGTSTDVTLTKESWFLKGGKKATKADLTVGSRVTIDTVKDTKTKALNAESIEIGVAAGAATAKTTTSNASSTASKTTSTASKTTGTTVKAPASSATQSKSTTGTASGTKE